MKIAIVLLAVFSVLPSSVIGQDDDHSSNFCPTGTDIKSVAQKARMHAPDVQETFDISLQTFVDDRDLGPASLTVLPEKEARVTVEHADDEPASFQFRITAVRSGLKPDAVDVSVMLFKRRDEHWLLRAEPTVTVTLDQMASLRFGDDRKSIELHVEVRQGLPVSLDEVGHFGEARASDGQSGVKPLNLSNC